MVDLPNLGQINHGAWLIVLQSTMGDYPVCLLLASYFSQRSFYYIYNYFAVQAEVSRAAGPFGDVQEPGSGAVLVVQTPEGAVPIVAHPSVKAISFTGGTATGRIVAASAAPLFKKLSLELGGKNPCIIDDTIDLRLTSRRIVWGKFVNPGQTCICFFCVSGLF